MQKALESRVVRGILIGFVAFMAACLAIFSLELFRPPRPLTSLMPTRTPTRRAAPTITPVAYPPTPPLVLADNLKDAQNFPQASGVKLGYEYQDGTYLLSPPSDPGFVRVLNQNFTDPDYRNLSLEAMGARTVNSGAVEYGVLFWHGEDEQGRERFLAFTINSKSAFRLIAYEPLDAPAEGGQVYQITEVIPLTQSPTIKQDTTPNKIRIDVHPRRMLAYINDELVLDTDAKIINDWRVRRDWDGKVGLIALTMDAPDAIARFSQFDIYADIKQP